MLPLSRDKQIVRAVNSQAITLELRDVRGKSASHSARSKFIKTASTAGQSYRVAAIRHKQIAPAVKGQSKWGIKPGSKGGSHSGRSKFIDVPAPT